MRELYERQVAAFKRWFWAYALLAPVGLFLADAKGVSWFVYISTLVAMKAVGLGVDCVRMVIGWSLEEQEAARVRRES